MKNMTLEHIAEACHGIYHGSQENRKKTVHGIAIDSRKIEPDWLFIATKGERVDGHSFIGQVMEKGALCVVCEQEPEDKSCTFIRVEDSFQALRDIAAFYRRQLAIKVVGITGSVGKTSTKEMVAGVLSARYRVLKTAGNFNNEVGLPLTIFQIAEEHEVAVLEMGISDFGEMSRLTAIARPDICVITNIGQCHLENLGNRDGVLRAKTEIFEGMAQDGSVVLNGADDKLATIAQVRGKPPYFFDSETCYAENIESRGLLGTSCLLHIEGRQLRAEIQVPGRHQVSNAMAAVWVAKLLGLTDEEIERGIQGVQAIGGRNHIIAAPDYTIVDDCYNANPVSMKAALDLLVQADGRRVAILGDMFELGTDSEAMHESVGAYAMQVLSEKDAIICIGARAAQICRGAERADGAAAVYHFADKAEFLEQRNALLQSGDTILVKASHGMAFETIVKELAG